MRASLNIYEDTPASTVAREITQWAKERDEAMDQDNQAIAKDIEQSALRLERLETDLAAMGKDVAKLVRIRQRQIAGEDPVIQGLAGGGGMDPTMALLLAGRSSGLAQPAAAPSASQAVAQAPSAPGPVLSPVTPWDAAASSAVVGQLYQGSDGALYQALVAVAAGGVAPTPAATTTWRRLGALSTSGVDATEQQLMSAATIAGSNNVALSLRNLSGSDSQRVKQHNLRVLASGASGTGTIGTVIFATPLTSARAPRLTASIQGMVAAGAAKPIGVVPTFNANGQCTGYTINCPIALANTDQIDLGISVDEVFN